MSTKPHLNMVRVPVDTLIPWDGNANQGDVDALEESIRVNGFFDPLDVRAATNQVIGGNHRVLALKALAEKNPGDERYTHVDVLMHDVDAVEALRMHLAANEIARKSTRDDALLVNQLKELEEEAGSLEGSGLDDGDLSEILLSMEVPDFQPEEDPETRLDRQNVTDCPSCGHTFVPVTYAE